MNEVPDVSSTLNLGSACDVLEEPFTCYLPAGVNRRARTHKTKQGMASIILDSTEEAVSAAAQPSLSPSRWAEATGSDLADEQLTKPADEGLMKLVAGGKRAADAQIASNKGKCRRNETLIGAQAQGGEGHALPVGPLPVYHQITLQLPAFRFSLWPSWLR